MSILRFGEFILEFKKITSHESSSGRTRSIDIIHDDPSTDKSPAASVLLKNKLSDLEYEDIKSVKSDLPEWAIRKIQKNGGYKYTKMMVTLNNLKFLKDEIKKGPLHCEYCNKGPLVIYDFKVNDIVQKLNNDGVRLSDKFDPKDGATCDHRNPKSKGGDKFSYSNLAVCCYRCNMKKSDINYETWLDFLNSPDGKKWLTKGNI